MTPSIKTMHHGASPRTIRRWLLTGLTALLLLLPATVSTAADAERPRLDSGHGRDAAAAVHSTTATERPRDARRYR